MPRVTLIGQESVVKNLEAASRIPRHQIGAAPFVAAGRIVAAQQRELYQQYIRGTTISPTTGRPLVRTGRTERKRSFRVVRKAFRRSAAVFAGVYTRGGALLSYGITRLGTNPARAVKFVREGLARALPEAQREWLQVAIEEWDKAVRRLDARGGR